MMWGQTPVVPGTADEEHSGHRKETPVNFGFKGGFTSSLFLVSQFSVNGVPIDEVQNNYKIGYFGSLFMRINFDRHFLQPEISCGRWQNRLLSVRASREKERNM